MAFRDYRQAAARSKDEDHPPRRHMETRALDDIEPVLNTLRQNDLTLILEITPPRLRVNVALAFADLAVGTWCDLSGLLPKSTSEWLCRHRTMPFGVAYRLSRVLGQDPRLLFEWHL